MILSDFFVINDKFVEAFRTRAIIDSENYHVIPEAYEYILCSYNDEKLREYLSLADIPRSQSMITDYASYYTDEALGISFGTLKALNSYAEILISYEDLTENISTNNDIWYEVLPYLG